ncbi:acyltransferase family protein [Palleniella muris]|uniref:acyltransferase family protein n=1 Tax=Palleniella muris TaxID=3038145 RepID=UPI003BAE200C
MFLLWNIVYLLSCDKRKWGGKTLLYHHIVDKFLFADIKNGYWYLWVLAIFTISERLFRLCKLKCWVQDVALALGIYTVFCFLWKTLGIYSSLVSIYMCVLYFPFFIFGYLVRKYNLQKKLLSDNVFTAALVGFVCAFYLLHFSGIVYTVSNRLIVPLCGIIILQRIMVDREGRHTILDRALSFIGIHTLDVYVLHYFIVTSLNLQSIGWWGMSTSNDLLLFVLACVISLPIAYMTIAIGMIAKKSELLRKLIYG